MLRTKMYGYIYVILIAIASPGISGCLWVRFLLVIALIYRMISNVIQNQDMKFLDRYLLINLFIQSIRNDFCYNYIVCTQMKIQEKTIF